MTMPFFPAGMTTAIGSFPYSEPNKAWKLISQSLDIPTWPQLPKRNFREHMNYQFLEGFPCVVCNEEEGKIWFHLGKDEYDQVGTFYQKFLLGDLEPFRISSDFALGLHFLEKKLGGEGKHYPWLKGHVTGPLTVSLCITDQDKKAVFYDDEMQEVILKGLQRKIAWQIGLLRRFSDKVILFIDEPVMAGFGTSAYLGLSRDDVLRLLGGAIQEVHSQGALAGVHCCGNTDWGVVLQSGVDVASFDAYNYAISMSLYPEELREFFGREGVLAWGIVPNSKEVHQESVATLLRRLREGFSLLQEEGFEEEELWWRCLLTPSCGAGTMEGEDVEQVFSLLKGLGEEFQREFKERFGKVP